MIRELQETDIHQIMKIWLDTNINPKESEENCLVMQKRGITNFF